MKISGSVIQKGSFKGKVTFIKDEEDLKKLDEDSIAVLNNSPKSVSMQAMQKASSILKVGESETSHLMLCIGPDIPFASIPSLSELEEYENTYQTFELSDLAKKRKKGEQPVIVIKDINYGQKAARIRYINNLGFSVPRFEVLDFKFCNEALKTPRIEEYIRENYNPKISFPVAVRSCANLEDLFEDGFAGVFDSFLSVSKNELVEKIIKVLYSLKNADSSKYDEELMMSVIIQEMVSKPLYSGTTFVYSGETLIESVYLKYASELMDGTIQPDVKLVINQKNPAESVDKCFLRLNQQAMEIKRLTGLDDMEFVIDSNNKIWWVQARGLPGKRDKEYVDLNKIDIGKHLIDTLHYRLTEANQIEAEEFDKDGTPKIIFSHPPSFIGRCTPYREIKYHSELLGNLNEIKRMTQWMNSFNNWITANYKELSLPNLYAATTLHAAMRNGSFGIRSRFKHQWDSPKLRNEVSKIFEPFDYELFYACNESSTLLQVRALNSDNPDEYFYVDTRKVPTEEIIISNRNEFQKISKTFPKEKTEAEILQSLQTRLERRDTAYKDLNDYQKTVADYLQTKAILNESLPWIRGYMFYQFARTINSTEWNQFEKNGFEKADFYLHDMKHINFPNKD